MGLETTTKNSSFFLLGLYTVRVSLLLSVEDINEPLETPRWEWGRGVGKVLFPKVK